MTVYLGGRSPVREAYDVEQEVGMHWYVSDTPGIGGSLKRAPDHFQVTEIEDGTFEAIDADPADYPAVIVRVTLTDWDTFGFARRLAKELGIHHEAIRWAGTKDKAAISTQLFSIRQLDPLVELPAIPGATMEPVGRFGRQLSFGDLQGNAFTIRVTAPEVPERHVPITDELLAFGNGTIGVPNYFGQQRFGSIRPITHRVGLAIVAGSWEDAVLTYVGTPSDREPETTQQARRYVEETRDLAGALERFPPHLTHERRLCRALANAESITEETYRTAFDTLANSLKQLFVHAVQSVIFNEILSERLAQGIPFNRAVEGDVVCFGEVTDTLGTIPDPTKTQRVTADRVDTINRHIASGRAFITAPLVGTETEFGRGDIGELERDVLEQQDVTPADFELPEPYSSTGYRRAILATTDVTVTDDPLEFSFALPSGSYATVIMREYLKVHPEDLS